MADNGKDDYRGLDVGTSRIVLAKPNGERPTYNIQLNAFIALPYAKMTEKMLVDEGIYHRVSGNEILAFGNRVDEFANMLGGDTRRPMKTGVLNPGEPKSREMMALALEEMCGKAKKNAKICFSVPSAPPDGQSELIFHEHVIKDVLTNLGYQAEAVNEGMAIIYAELADDDLTGIGISFGGGLCNVSVAYLGLPILSFSTERAGDYIDQSAAKVTGQTPTTVRLHKESKDFRIGDNGAAGLDQALTIYHRDVINHVVERMQQEMNASQRLPRSLRSLPLVYGGGTAMVKGFEPELKKALDAARLPVEITDIRQSKSTSNTTAKGMLLASMLNM
ncbi:MAG: hypothetical protein R3F54_04940 [Alphaproteobacteria bacterium]